MPTQRLSGRIARLVVLGAVLFAVASADPARAATTAGVEVFPGWVAFGSSVTCTGHGPSRTFSSKQSATFLQSWLPDSIYKKLPAQTRPAQLPVCTLIMQYAVNGTRQPALHIYYAADGHSAWISSDRKKWIVAPQSQRVINSFEGRGVYEPVASSSSVPTSTVPVRRNVQVRRSHSSSTGPIVVGVALVGVASLLALIVFRRRRA